MSLFKNNILKQYNILKYEDDMLFLQCSKNDVVKAPFAGKINNDKELVCGEYCLRFSNVNLTIKPNSKVKAGDVIGIPMVKRFEGREITGIGVSIVKKKNLEDILVYLRRMDEDEVVASEIEKPQEEVSKNKKKYNDK